MTTRRSKQLRVYRGFLHCWPPPGARQFITSTSQRRRSY